MRKNIVMIGLAVLCILPSIALSAGTETKKIIFLSSKNYSGDLGGLAGADSKCQALAKAAGLSGLFKAWLSDCSTAAKDRLTHHTGLYVRTDGATVANNWRDLTDGWIKEPIQCDEKGQSAVINEADIEPYSFGVWTNTNRSGGIASEYMCCNNWTASQASKGLFSNNGAFGSYDTIDKQWTAQAVMGSFELNFTGCERSLKLYCVEQ